MANLEFINQTKALSVTSLDVTGVFTAKYDVYQVHISTDLEGAGYFEIRLLQADDSLANESKYDIASLDLRGETAFVEYKFVDQNGGVGWRGIGGYLNDGEGYGFTLNVFNPFADDKYTYGKSQNSGMSDSATHLFGTNALGVYKSTQSIGGMRVTNSSGQTHNYINVTTYGIK